MKDLWKTLHIWHRRFGITAAVFVIMLAITGLLLNHTDRLKLNHTYIQNEMLLNLYDVDPKVMPHGFRIKNVWISQVGERVYFNNEEIIPDVKQLIGAVKIKDLFYIAVDGQLLLFTEAGQLIERLGGTEGVPAGMRALGVSPDEKIIIRGAHGDYQPDLETLHWHEEDEIHAEWSASQKLPEDLQNTLLKNYRGKGLSLERIVLDLHSGRIVGGMGIYIVDIAAILFLFLAASGIWMWLKIK